MKIKRFFASSLREALTQVKNKLGPDAVILSNNSVDGGIELVAAIDYDESAIKDSMQNGIYDDGPDTFNKNTSLRNSYSNEFKQNKGTPGWLQQLREEHQHNIEMGNVKVEGLVKQPMQDDIKEDIVNFSRKLANEEERHDPKISTFRVDDLVAKQSRVQNQFSEILNQQQSMQDNHADSHADNPFDLDRLINESDDEFNSFQNDSLTYSKPGMNARSNLHNNSQNKAHNNMRSNHSADTYSKPSARNTPFTAEKPMTSTRINNVHQLNTSKSYTQPKAKSTQNVKWSQDPMLTEMKEQIESLKSMMQNQLSGLAWGNINRQNPHRSELLQRLFKLGLKPSISEAVLRQINEPQNLEDGWKKALSIISRGIKIAETDLITEGGMVAFVGPTGVGKTTTIAKLASRFALANKPSDMALVSMDSFRVGAQEQLKIYAQLLRVPVYMVSNEAQLTKTLAGLKDKRLVLIDTAGMHQNDVRMTEQLSMLRHSIDDIKIISVLSASAQSHALHEVIDTFKHYDLDGCVVTKMDESSSLGGILSVMIENQLPLHYITNGQKVPEDIRPGRVSNLLKDAMAMVRERKEAYDYNDIAMSFMGELLQANG
ncbi:MAG: flagellar biosynthesis protein FlhF [Gammaproteobacteria bacterium]|nr:flagellar biosynthesis protein FlhF [Gammaproteobacteria bacterium]